MTERLSPIVEAYLAGSVPANIALMRLCIEADSPEQVRAAIEEAQQRVPGASEKGTGRPSRVGEGQGEAVTLLGDGGPAPQPSHARGSEPVAGAAPGRLAALSALLDQHGSAWATIRAVMAEAEHDHSTGSAEEALAHWAMVFDRLARAQPEAGVALYALGSPELLEAATGEIVGALRAWGLVEPTSQVLEIGCGIGRFVRALAPDVDAITGIDISQAMIAAARERCSGLGNVRFHVSSGRDLAGFEDEGFDLALAADVFPYLVQAGGDLALRHVDEAFRVLRPGGTLAILNYSYRGDYERDRQDVFGISKRAGFHLPEEPHPTFKLWDGAVFLLRKPG